MNTQLRCYYDELHDLCAGIPGRVQIMEVCGTHTVSFFRSGIRAMLPSNFKLLSGPGCPVCVTAQSQIDAAIELANQPGIIMTTYADMLRVPGKLGSLERSRAHGADVRVVNSARTALEMARAEPARTVVFLGVGFETTAPATAATVLQAHARQIDNFSVLMCHKLVVPAMLALLRTADVPLDGFLCPGHVSVIIGANAFRPVVSDHQRPCVIAGFEPLQLLGGLVHLVRQIVSESAFVENVYPAVVSERGNLVAQNLLQKVFTVEDAPWRALGNIPSSGFAMASTYQRYDVLQRFGLQIGEDQDVPTCRCGEVIQGRTSPLDCPLFDHGCTPLNPIGPCMVSSEGACAAWYKYQRVSTPASLSVARN